MATAWCRSGQPRRLPDCRWTNGPAYSPALINEVEKKTRGSGAEVIKKKGGAGFAVGVSIADVVHSHRPGPTPHLAGLDIAVRSLRVCAMSVFPYRPSLAGRACWGMWNWICGPKNGPAWPTPPAFCAKPSTKSSPDRNPNPPRPTALPSLRTSIDNQRRAHWASCPIDERRVRRQSRRFGN